MPDAPLIGCNSCGATNRVPLENFKDGREPVCGKCKTPLAFSTPVPVTDATFPDLVEHSRLPVLLDLWAEWCGPCRMIAPVIDELAREMRSRIRVAKLNIDENPVTASRFRIQSIPALLILKGGLELDRIIGMRSKADISDRLQRAISNAA